MTALKTGTRLGDYQILRLIARGGMGEVYEAHDLTLDRRVALKIMAADNDHDDFQARFMREARTLAKVSHPNIVTIYSINTHLEYQYIAMEYVHGISLKEILAGNRIESDIAVSLFDQVLRAIKTLHDRGIIHRDLKPSNILIRDNGQVKILDLGIAKALGVSGNTDPGIKIGTPHYMAPEVRDGAEATVESDIWSLGAVMFECLTCKHVSASMEGDHLKISKADFGLIPQSFRYIIGSMAATNPEDRYKDAGDIIDDFRRLGETPPPASRFAEFREGLRILIDDIRPDTPTPSYAHEQPTMKFSISSIPRAETPAVRRSKSKKSASNETKTTLWRRFNDYATVFALIVTAVTVSYIVYRWKNHH